MARPSRAFIGLLLLASGLLLYVAFLLAPLPLAFLQLWTELAKIDCNRVFWRKRK